MQNIIINENVYRVQREFKGQRNIKEVIIESIKNNTDRKPVTLTENTASCYNNPRVGLGAGGTLNDR